MHYYPESDLMQLSENNPPTSHQMSKKTESNPTVLPPPAPVVNLPLPPDHPPPTAPAAPQADAPTPPMKEIHGIMHAAAKAVMRMERPFILSSWGQAEKRGEVTARDKGMILDGKNIKELRTAASKRGSDGQAVVAAIDRYLAAAAMEKALAAFSVAIAEKGHLQAAVYRTEAEVANAEKALAAVTATGDADRITAAENALNTAMEAYAAARGAVKDAEKTA